MSAFAIRVLAIALMVIDHVGAFLLMDNFGLRIIGRLAFPLFAWLIANGYVHTADKGKYLQRLLMFALISQIPYFLIFDVFGMGFVGLNIFFTLSLGLVAIWIFENYVQVHKGWNNKFGGLLVVIGLMSLGEWLRVDYGWRGVGLVLAMFVGYRSRILMILTAGTVLAWPAIYKLLMGLAGWQIVIPEIELIGVVGLAALPIIFAYNHKPGFRGAKYLFYIFYPAHLFVLYVLVRVIYNL